MPTLIAAIVAVLLGVPVAALVGARRGRAASVSFADGRLIVRPDGVHRLWARAGIVDVPVTAVTDVRVAEAWTVPLGARSLGSRRPGSLVAGSFGGGADRAFWLVRKGRRALVIDLEGQAYARIVVEVEAPEAVERALRTALPHLPAAPSATAPDRPLLRPLPPDLRP